MLWGLLLMLPEPQAGEPTVWLRSLTLVGEPVQYSLWDSHPVGIGFDFITPVPLLPLHWGFPFHWV